MRSDSRRLAFAAPRRAAKEPIAYRSTPATRIVGGSDGHPKPAARDQALHPQTATRSRHPSEIKRAPEPKWRVEADPGLRARRLRQDDAGGRLAGNHSGKDDG